MPSTRAPCTLNSASAAIGASANALPNGAGKSTLIGCLLGLVEGSTGSVALSGRTIESLSREDIARLVAYVPQSSEVVFAYSARQMVLMGRTPHFGRAGAPSAIDRLRVEEALVSCGIAHLGDRLFIELSGGERQLVLIARALAQDAPLLVMDEPSAGLDLGNQGRVLALVRELSRAGKGVVMTTHMPEHAFVLACRVALLKEGRILDRGSAFAVCEEAAMGQLYGARLCRIQNPDRHDLAAFVPDLGADERTASSGQNEKKADAHGLARKKDPLCIRP